jgi:MYXO-CTERM domain-containing protein
VPWPRALLAVLFVSRAACAPSAPAPDLASSGAPLQGGSLAATDRASVGLAAWRAGRSYLCSGALVSPNVVLAARHCVTTALITTVTCGATPLGSSLSFDQITVTTDKSLPDDAGAEHAVKSIAVVSGDDACGADLAFLVLSDPVSPSEATPYAPRFSPPAPGEPYGAVGYGETCADASSELCYLESGQRRRRDGLAVACVDDCPRDRISVTEWGGEAGLCLGDSGGPALDEQGRLIGIAVRGETDAVGNCTGPVYSLLSSWEAEIRAAVKASAAQAGIELPAWADETDGGGDAAADALSIDAGAEPADANAAGSADAGQDAQSAPPPTASDGPAPSGCSCRSARPSGSPRFAAFLAASLLFVLLRPRRRPG